MISYVSKDLFETGADCLVNTVNCEGFMSKGIAYQFKQRYPENDEVYKEACRNGTMQIGTVLCHKENDTTIINFPTKDRWRRPSTMAYIEKGLDAMIQELPHLNVKTIAIPPLGCGNGGLSWEQVRKLIDIKLQPLEQYQFIVCQPGNGIVSQLSKEDKDPTAKSLILLRIQEKLSLFNMNRLLCSCVFINYFCQRDVFSFSRWNNGPESLSIKEEAKHLKAYKEAHNFTSKEAYQAIYIRVCSKRTDSIVKNTEDAIEKAVQIVNSITDERTLVTATAILHILCKDAKSAPAAYSPACYELLCSMVGCVTEEIEEKAKNALIDHNIANMDLCGDLHLAN